ncbi:MAG: mechanosensitive ion channel [Gemmatimonadetes bacterium]|nr:mechanosensitive ion channel [Gemmatimonadota bacterium]
MELANVFERWEWWEQYVSPFAHIFLPFVILVLGWLVAHLVSWVIRRVLLKTKLDDKVLGLVMGRDASTDIHAERWISRAVFYLVMVFVLVAFFQTLGMTAMTEPLNKMLNQIFTYLPKLVSAAVLLLVAWIVGSLLRRVVTGVLSRANIEQRLAEPAGLEAATESVLPQTIGNVVYWLTFLVLLPAVLDALGLQGLLQPVQQMMAKVIGFLPNLFAAALIMLIGWLGARIVQQVVTNLLEATGINNFGRRVGLATGLGIESLSGLAGTLSYAVILILAVIAALESLNFEAISNPASSMLEGALAAVPSILVAAGILLIGYLVARLVARVVDDVLRQIGFNSLLQRLGIAEVTFAEERSPSIAEATSAEDRPPSTTDATFALNRPPSQLAGYIAMVAVLLFSAIEATAQLGFQDLAGMLVKLTLLFGKIVLGAVIFGFGLYLASVFGRIASRRGGAYGSILGTIVRIAIVSLALFMGLREMGIANEIITLAFGLILGSAAIAAAIAFGMGGRDLAKKHMEQWTQNLEEINKDGPSSSEEGEG